MNQKALTQFKNQQKTISSRRFESNDYPKELKIIAEGDSWFDYPFRKDVIDYLRKKGYAIQNLSNAGDTLENMVWGTDYKIRNNKANYSGPVSLQKTLNEIKKQKPQVVLFSAGGNDIVGSEILAYLNHKNSKPSDLVNKTIFQEKLSRIEIALRFFIEAIHKKSSNSQRRCCIKKMGKLPLYP